MEGAINIDKPGGMTSHDVVNRIRRLTGVRRVGHAGTLDPLATGILLLGVGRATRLIEYLVGQRKTYEATIRLGQETDTYDADGEVAAERPFAHIASPQLQQALEPFRGPIQQRPPIYSAIKRDGQPLYKLARQGETVDIPLRDATIYELELLDFALPEARLRVTCSSGTYIRSLAHDLGRALGCGGHITALRRTAVGDFGLDTAVSLTDLTESNWHDWLRPSDTAVAHLPRLDITAAETDHLQHGRRPPRRPNLLPAPLTRAYDPDGRFIGIVAVNENYLQPRKIFL
ncbi:MAG: tRNA pseudouridine(55) synthase TruB [Chloroflexi bacterium]|nr:tRNA pseudouridine(55) synthase TruB [Chloroflexota bacterium]